MANKSGKITGAKLTLVVLSVFLFLLLFASPAFAATYGDINDDGDINVQDVVLVMKHVLELDELTAAQEAVADVNGDGNINVQDVTLIMQYALGLIDEFPMGDLEVSSVKALNARQVEVVYNRNVTDEPVENPFFYEVYKQGALTTNVFGLTANGAVARLQEDKKTVILTLNTGAAFANFTTTNRVIVRKAVGLEADYTNSAVALSDVTLPTLVSVESIGTRAIALTFSEPVKPTVAPIVNVVLNDGALGLNLAGAQFDDSLRRVVIDATADLTIGTTYTITLKTNNNLEDYVGLKAVPASKTFVHTPLTSAPTVSAEAISETTLRLTFNRAVSLTTAGANVEFRYGFNSELAMKRTSANMNGAAVSFTAAAVVGSGNTKYDVTFANPMIPGSGSVYIHYLTDTNAAGRIVDGFGNVLPNNSTASFTVVPDTIRPTVTAAAVTSNTTIDVTYSEPVNGATTTTNYTLTNPQGNPVPITNAVAKAGSPNTYTLTVGSMAAGGVFTFTVSENIRDLSVAQNRLVAYSTALNVTDNMVPTVVSVGHNAARTKIFVQYSEPMGASALLASSYRTGDAAAPGGGTQTVLPAGSSLSQTGSLVTITLPAALPGSQLSLIIGQVADLAGNTLVTIQTVKNLGLATYNPTVTNVQVFAANKIRFTVDRHLSAVTFGKIKTTGIVRTAIEPTTYVNNANGTATITATFADASFPHDLNGLLTLKLEADALTDLNGVNSLEEIVTPPLGGVHWWDYIGPAIVTGSVITLDDDGDGMIDRILIGFTEDLSVASLATTDFAVAGYSISGISLNNAVAVTFTGGPAVGSAVTLILVESGSFDTAVKPAVTLVGSVSDNTPQANTVGPLTAVSSLDKALPVIVSATRTAANSLTLVFSEPVYTNEAGTLALVAGDISHSALGLAVVEPLLTIVHTAGATTATATTTTATVATTSKVGAESATSFYDAAENAARIYLHTDPKTYATVN